MIEPTLQDVGRAVTYHNPYNQETEEGVISSVSRDWVYVIYGRMAGNVGQPGVTGQATSRENLSWSTGT